MVFVLQQVFSLLTSREKKLFFILCLLFLFVSVFETLGVGLVFFFLDFVAGGSSAGLFVSFFDFVFSIAGLNQSVFSLGILVVCFLAVGFFVKSSVMYAMYRFTAMHKASLSVRILEGYLSSDFAWFNSRSHSELSRIVLQEVDQIVGMALNPLLRVFAQFVTVFGITLFLFIVSPLVSIVSFVLIGGLYLVVYIVVAKILQRAGAERQSSNQERYRIFDSALLGFKMIRISRLSTFFVSSFREAADRLARSQYVEQSAADIPKFLLETFVFSTVVLLVVVLVYYFNFSEIDLFATFGLFGAAGLKILPAFQAIYHSFGLLNFSHMVLKNVRDELSNVEKLSTRGSMHGGKVVDFNESITFENVSFRFHSVKDVLTSLNFNVAAGSRVAFVGASGSGKSTLLNIFCGLLTPSTGKIYVDDEEICRDNLTSWQDKIGYVSQDVFFVEASLLRNVAFGVDPDSIDFDAVVRSCTQAQLHDFIVNDLPQGYDTVLGDHGVRLSGGQIQRLAIARALYRKPKVLVLDEATSALDIHIEKSIMDSVFALDSDITVIIVAHRLSTVSDCDSIYLLDSGRIVDHGSFDELLDRSTFFSIDQS